MPEILAECVTQAINSQERPSSKALADDAIARDDGSVLPPKKPPMPPARQRWRS
jgi:hypothetical protein